MKQLFFIPVLLLLATSAVAQRSLVKDLDGDHIADSVFMDSTASAIVCKLSGNNFTSITSKTIDILNETAGLVATKNGFAFFNDWMRAGYKNQFRFDSATKKIRLIGMSRYEFGNAMNDGSGESSVNLLTNDYVGNWNYRSEQDEKLVSIPTIKTKMVFGKVWLEDFGEETYFAFSDKCAILYQQHKDRMIAAKKTKAKKK